MIVKSLELSNFRNYNHLLMDFSKNTNILYGDNAQGKTNVLEAVYLCSTTKSHRGSKDKDIIRINQDESHIRMMIERDGVGHRLDMHLKKNKPKGVAIDGIPIKKSSELFGLIHIVSFSPEDLSIIKNGPSERRKFIDMELCQLDRTYLHQLMNYNKIINQRNSLLKQISYNCKLLDTIEIWNDQLIQYGTRIIKARKLFIDELNEIIMPVHKKLSGGREELKIFYDPNVEEEYFKKSLEKNLEKDLKLKMTSVGPHRDDLNFFIGEEDIKRYGSQGQQRTSALSLKLSEIELVKLKIKDEPVLLLDDVLSELDRNRQNELLNYIKGIQTIITCTGLEEFIKKRITIDKIYHVMDGTVIEQS